MAYKLINSIFSAQANDFIREFVVDSEADVNILPLSCAGSTAIVAEENGAIFIANTRGEWRKI